MGRRYRITHVTTYSYTGGDVTGSLGTFHLRPRNLPWQQVTEHNVTVSPQAAQRATRVDLYGNSCTNFHVVEPHAELVITAVTDCEVSTVEPPPDAMIRPWEEFRLRRGDDVEVEARPDDDHGWEAYDFLLASPRISLPAEAHTYAATSFTPGRPAGEALIDLLHRIHDEFEYESGSTTVTTSVEEVLTARHGVCQDFAQVMISCLRTQGMAARYVSGYLATVPPPGRPRLVGADASHAWVAVWLPGTTDRPGFWWHLDPTNDRPCDESHATVAWGRDYGDVAPVRGIIWTTSSKSSMKVSVDMAPLPLG
ncbi:MAG: transglutaminase family protein [Propionibacteriales bacterium]|nr:transglutaminase family protein [Propionibacteriales bacterium]